MTLWINTTYKYADAYYTNWNYLRNMTESQMKRLGEIWWDGWATHIRDGLWYIPVAFNNDTNLKDSVNVFIYHLNADIKRL